MSECLGLPAAAGPFAALEHPYHVEGLLLCQGVYCDGARGAGADDRDALDGHSGRGCVISGGDAAQLQK